MNTPTPAKPAILRRTTRKVTDTQFWKYHETWSLSGVSEQIRNMLNASVERLNETCPPIFFFVTLWQLSNDGHPDAALSEKLRKLARRGNIGALCFILQAHQKYRHLLSHAEIKTLIIRYVKPEAEKAHIRNSRTDEGNAAQYAWAIYKNHGVGLPPYAKELAEANYPPALHLMGDCYTSGQGIQQNPQAAHAAYLSAANQGYAPSQHKTAKCYEEGLGVNKDLDMAVKYYRYAANQDYVPAKLALGLLYQFTLNEPEKAYEQYQAPANRGNPEALFYIGLLYYKKDNYLTAHYFSQAADKGHTEAQCNIGIFHLEGIGVPKNKMLAIQYLTKAAKQGETRSIKILKDLREEMKENTKPLVQEKSGTFFLTKKRVRELLSEAKNIIPGPAPKRRRR